MGERYRPLPHPDLPPRAGEGVTQPAPKEARFLLA